MALHNDTDYYNRRLGAMEKEFSSFRTHYKELSDFIQPRRGRFLISDRNRGQKVHNNIINSAAGQALKIARSGMLAGTMSPSRPWFDLETPDPDMMEDQEVKEWLADVVLILRTIFNASNLYSQSSVMLGELLLFGTGCLFHVDDFDDVARFYAQTIGSYFIAQNNRLEVDTLARKFEWTVQQIVQEFGLDNTSTFVNNAWDKGDYETWAPVTHFIEPNVDSKSRPTFNVDLPFSSIYFEPGNTGPNRNKFLRKSGFREFPAYVPRWDVTGEDVYGTDCPGMTSLGDVKSLQVEEKEKGKAIMKMVSPPLHGPPGLKNVPVSQLPGGLTIYGQQGDHQLKSIFQIDPRLGELREDMNAITQRINQAFFVDMFLAISTMEGIQPRNELDILSRNEERLLQLGPVLERLHGEFLEKMINRTFNQSLDAGILPPIPEALAGQDLRVKFISSLAIAQRAVVTNDLDRLLLVTTNMVQVDPNAVKKLDGQQFLDEYGRAIGVPPRVLRSDDAVAEIEAEEQRQIAEQQAVEQAQMMAQTAQAAAGAKTDEKNLLTDLTGGTNDG